MARSRNIKPGFFNNEDLVEFDPIVRLLFIGLWMIADRKGRLEDRPKKIKMELFPCDDINVDDALNKLQEYNFLKRYTFSENQYIQIINFEKHQSPHKTEKDSVIPACCDIEQPLDNGTCTVNAPLNNGGSTVTLPPDSLIHRFTDSLIPDSLTSNSLVPVCDEKSKNRFEEFWSLYPRQRRGSKVKAEKAYTRAAKRVTEEEIRKGLDAYILSDEVARGYAKGAEAWLNDDRWTNDYSIQARAAPDKLTYSDDVRWACQKAIGMTENEPNFEGFEYERNI